MAVSWFFYYRFAPHFVIPDWINSTRSDIAPTKTCDILIWKYNAHVISGATMKNSVEKYTNAVPAAAIGQHG